MKLNHIVCMDRNRAIGKDNKLPFDCPLDMKRFKAITKGTVVIMGRKTYESIGRPLPGRTNIVLSRDEEWIEKQKLRFEVERGPELFTSLREALDWCRENDHMEIYICGGQELYTRTLPYISTVKATVLDLEIEGADAFYPQIPPNMFFQIWKHDFEGGMFSDSAPVYANKDLSRIDF